MPQFVIEREVRNAASMTQQQLDAAVARSASVLNRLGPDIRWRHSYVAGDKIYCIFDAASKELIREHARQSGLPASTIALVTAIVGPD